MENKVINIMGNKWEIKFMTVDEDVKLEKMDGYCDTTTRKIVIAVRNITDDTVEDILTYMNKVIRHEVVHAMLFECGLESNSDWASNEELVDWIAIKFGALKKVIKKAEIKEEIIDTEW